MTTGEGAADRFGIRWLVILALAALALVALERSFSILSRPAPRPAFSLTGSGAPKTYLEALGRANREIDDAERRVEARPGEWLMHEMLARRHLAKARLTGSFDDYAATDSALAGAFALAPQGAGPHMTKASLDFTMHRLADAERSLDSIAGYAVPPDPGEVAEIAAMRGDIAFYRGRYVEAAAAYDEADRMAPGTADFRRAIFHSRTGRPDLADETLARAEAGLGKPTPQLVANIELRRGLLDLERGRWDDALAHFRKANTIFPGHWLVEEHIAEVTALKGDAPAAEKLYADIIRRTGHPDYMDAMAALARKRGDPAAMQNWTARAAEGWKRRLAIFPEAAYGHALDHCFASENWACALNLAQRDHANRPYGEAKILLARALLRNDRAAEAKPLIDEVFASPWRTPLLHAVASEVYAALGDPSAAEAQRREALRLDPHVFG